MASSEVNFPVNMEDLPTPPGKKQFVIVITVPPTDATRTSWKARYAMFEASELKPELTMDIMVFGWFSFSCFSTTTNVVRGSTN